MNSSRQDVYPAWRIAALLITGGSVLAGLLLAAFFVLVSALSLISPVFMKSGLILIIAASLAWLFFVLITVLSIFKKREALPLIATRNVWLKYFLPVARSISKRIGMDPEKVIRSCVLLNNDFVLNMKATTKDNRIMILLPHCIQLYSCGMKLTSDPHNCKNCGRCPVGALIELSDSSDVDIFVAAGGTMARKRIAEKRPDLILAVACERDLISGIRDSLPMKVVGVLNERPEGPCKNTLVDTAKIAELILAIKQRSLKTS